MFAFEVVAASWVLRQFESVDIMFIYPGLKLRVDDRGFSQPVVKEGSGSLEQDGPLSVVAMKKEEQTGLMHDHRLGKGQRHAHKTSQTLAQGVVPSLHVGSFSRLFSHRSVLLLWDHRRVSRPEIREAVPLPIP